MVYLGNDLLKGKLKINIWLVCIQNFLYITLSVNMFISCPIVIQAYLLYSLSNSRIRPVNIDIVLPLASNSWLCFYHSINHTNFITMDDHGWLVKIQQVDSNYVIHNILAVIFSISCHLLLLNKLKCFLGIAQKLQLIP